MNEYALPSPLGEREGLRGLINNINIHMKAE